jgi:hypothetical protein
MIHRWKDLKELVNFISAWTSKSEMLPGKAEIINELAME